MHNCGKKIPNYFQPQLSNQRATFLESFKLTIPMYCSKRSRMPRLRHPMSKPDFAEFLSARRTALAWEQEHRRAERASDELLASVERDRRERVAALQHERDVARLHFEI